MRPATLNLMSMASGAGPKHATLGKGMGVAIGEGGFNNATQDVSISPMIPPSMAAAAKVKQAYSCSEASVPESSNEEENDDPPRSATVKVLAGNAMATLNTNRNSAASIKRT